MSTEARADQLVVGSLAAAAAMAAGNAIVNGAPPAPRQIVGFTFVAVGLSVGAMFAPGLAGGMAVLVAVSAAFVYGQPLWDTLSSVTSSTPSATTSTPHPAHPHGGGGGF
jgi:hypothetical protein